ncbi:MAG: TetR/AcrR family transcriptional regulator [Candidatus Cloacimonadota bacterium]|nr:TetR/AcrR family transcriptional regulator [Candidatus Cloacimonadota bacterium]
MDKKEEILRAAETVFLKYGLAKCTMEDIAKACSVKKTALYYYFDSRDDIFVKMISNKLDEMMDELVSFVDKAKSTKEKIKSFMQKRIELVLNNKPFVEIFHDDGCLKILKEKRKKIIPNEFNIVSNIVEEGLAKGDIFADATKPVILMILGVTYGSLYANMEIGVEWDYKKQINSAVNIIFNGIGKKIEKECE